MSNKSETQHTIFVLKVDGTSTWISPHCDAQTQTVLVEIEKDENITKNNPRLVQYIQENSCPGNCTNNGQCVNGSCDFLSNK